MTAKTVRFNGEAAGPLCSGVDVAADLVATTIGPAGRAVLVGQTYHGPKMLRGGYAITQQLDLEEAGRQAGVLVMRDLAWRTSDSVGDGTSTAIILARAFVRSGQRAILAGVSPGTLKEALEAHCATVVAELVAAARPVADDAAELARIATQAAGGDASIGEPVADAHARTGPDGVVLFEEGRGNDDHVQVDQGLHFNQGWISPHFADDQVAQSVEIDNPFILLHLDPITELGPILPVLEMMAKADRSLVIIAETVGGEALNTLVVNRQRAGFKVAAVKAPGAGAWRALMLEDIAAATGGTVIGAQFGTGLAKLRPEMLGRALKVRVTRTGTTITGGRGDPDRLAIRTREIREAIAHEQHLGFDREQHRQRLARLGAGIATVHVGGVTTTEIAQRLGRAKAASAAVLAAWAGGIVLGGGAALVHAGRRAEVALGGDLVGRMVGLMFAKALRAPLRAIADNACVDGRSVVNRIADDRDGLCFDAVTGRFVASATLVDPLAVLRTALVNSVSTAGQLLGVGATVGTAEEAAEYA